jgi:hypothetical protein
MTPQTLWLWAAWGLALGIQLAIPSESRAQAPTVINPRHEYNVKAAFLYSFGRYAEWPAEVFQRENAPFVIGVLGQDPFGGALDQIAEKKRIARRAIEVRHFNSLDECEACQILFISKTVPAEQRAAVIRQLAAKPVLLVGETPGFAREGGTLNFFLDQDTVRFELNINCVKRQRLTVDAKLLTLATVVEEP